jgi:hypothetical protein
MVDAGWNTLVGSHSGKISQPVYSFAPPNSHPTLYGDGHAAARCIETLG